MRSRGPSSTPMERPIPRNRALLASFVQHSSKLSSYQKKRQNQSKTRTKAGALPTVHPTHGNLAIPRYLHPDKGGRLAQSIARRRAANDWPGQSRWFVPVTARWPDQSPQSVATCDSLARLHTGYFTLLAGQWIKERGTIRQVVERRYNTDCLRGGQELVVLAGGTERRRSAAPPESLTGVIR